MGTESMPFEFFRTLGLSRNLREITIRLHGYSSPKQYIYYVNSCPTNAQMIIIAAQAFHYLTELKSVSIEYLK